MEAGSSLGTYRIVALLGAGGMGEVYRAHDTTLNREVAIKLLPAALAEQPARLARLGAEARTLAALNHPNVATIHSLEEEQGVRFLVMELVDGPTLASRLRRGPLPVTTALKLCRQIAEGLEAAHAKGIIHRDLKPSNVMVTGDERVKIVDFGLAKALGLQSVTTTSHSDTLDPLGMTASGAVLGTVPYMSPEQVRSDTVDERTDIWALGCVLYEMLTGQRAFGRKTFADTVNAILESKVDWERLPPETPASIRFLQRRCLQKNVRDRLQHVGDARVVIEDALVEAGEASTGPMQRLASQARRGPLPLAVAALLAAIVGAGLLRELVRPPATRPAVRTLDLLLPEGQRLVGPPALSPDGLLVAFAAVPSPRPPGADSAAGPGEGLARLYVRSTVSGETRPVPRTEGAEFPFFSPDAKWLGFFSGGEMKKIPLLGGEPVTLCEVRSPSPASWAPNERIYFAPSTSKTLAWVTASGGSPEAVPPPEGAPVGLDSPVVLPGGKALLLRVFTGVRESPLGILSLDTGKLVILRERGIAPRYVSSGHIVYLRAGGLMALPFDLHRLQVVGPETQVVDNVAEYSVSDDGSLAYVPGDPSSEKVLVWADRQGRETPLGLPRAKYGGFRLSPDGKRLAIEVEGATIDVWVHDLERGSRLRLTHEGNNGAPSWAPNTGRVAFCSDRAKSFGLYSTRADGTGTVERLLGGTNVPAWSSWSPDGKYLAFTDVGAGQPDLWVLPTTGDRKPFPLQTSRSSEWGAEFSPDGRWLAYSSDESGRFEVYVQPAPGRPGGRQVVSGNGGEAPRWSPLGDELFYQDGRKWMSVPVASGATLSLGTPRVLFEADSLKVPGIPYDVSPDGKRFLFVQSSRGSPGPTHLTVVLNWYEQLERLTRRGP